MKTELKQFISALALVAVGLMSANAQTVNTKRPHSDVHKNMIAKQATIKDQIRLIDNDAFIDFDDDLEPEPDIYTEGWNSKRVNPFKESDVPNTAVIDVRNYFIPHNGKVTSPYGYRKRFGRMHKGTDIGIRSNDTIYAAFDGKVRLTNYEAKGYGNYIIIRHPNDLETVYGHLNKFLVKPDQVVKAGDPIALGGNTGRSTGPHLHFETRYMGYAINPSAIFDFANHTTHTDKYTFSKSTYTQPRNYAPSREMANAPVTTPYKQSTTAKSSTYKVKKGDTLSKVARANGISLARLRKLNGLSKNSSITAGQTLKVK